jgi:hypothetical protein
MNNSTLSGNSADTVGGGIFSLFGTRTTRNTIIAGNTAPNNPDVSGTLVSQGHNLIGDGAGGTGYDSTDLVGTATNPIDPRLGPLQDNGGPTETMALLPGSPAIDAGDPTNAPQWDQRGPGYPRVVNGMIDIGAVFSLFDLELMGKKDALAFDLAGPLSQQRADLQVHLGKGENHFTFNPGLAAITNQSDVNVNVVGSNGNDFVNLNFGDILESRVNVSASNLGGSKTGASSTAPRDVLTFGALRAGIRNSSVDVNVGLGTGINNLAFNFGSDLGHLAGAGVASDFGPSTFNVNIAGSSRRQDVANITLFANGEVNTGSTLNFTTQFIAGNNSFNGMIDAANFQVDDDGGEFINGPDGTTAPHSGGAAHFNLRGGSGNDNFSLASINQDHTIELSGLLDVNIAAGAGKDNINVDLGGTGGFTDDDPFELLATNRAFRLRIAGGSGPDTIAVNVSNADTATFAYDIAIQGGSRRNHITFTGNNQGGDPNFGPAGAVFIDGGSDTMVDVSGNFPVVVESA